jgi:hypothetical protein
MVLDEDLKRVVLDEDAFKEKDGAESEDKKKILQGYGITVGEGVGKEYKVVFESDSEEIPEVELRYPSRYGKER